MGARSHFLASVLVLVSCLSDGISAQLACAQCPPSVGAAGQICAVSADARKLTRVFVSTCEMGRHNCLSPAEKYIFQNTGICALKIEDKFYQGQFSQQRYQPIQLAQQTRPVQQSRRVQPPAQQVQRGQFQVQQVQRGQLPVQQVQRGQLPVQQVQGRSPVQTSYYNQYNVQQYRPPSNVRNVGQNIRPYQPAIQNAFYRPAVPYPSYYSPVGNVYRPPSVAQDLSHFFSRPLQPAVKPPTTTTPKPTTTTTTTLAPVVVPITAPPPTLPPPTLPPPTLPPPALPTLPPGPVPKTTPELLAEIVNYDGWQCSTMVAADGSTQTCVVTQPAATTPVAAVKATGCGWLMPVFCDAAVMAAAALLAANAVADPVPVGYTLVAGVGYYKVHTEARNWDQAKTICEADGVNTHLAVPSTAADYDALMSFIKTVLPNNNEVFCGISDAVVTGVYKAVTNQPACTLGQVLFNPGEPNNSGGNEHCLEIGLSGIGRMNDVPCSASLPFVCEQILPSRLTPCIP